MDGTKNYVDGDCRRDEPEAENGPDGAAEVVHVADCTALAFRLTRWLLWDVGRWKMKQLFAIIVAALLCQDGQSQVKQAFAWPSWVQGSQAADVEPVRVVRFSLEPYRGWVVLTFTRSSPNDPLLGTRVPNCLNEVPGIGPFPQNGGDAQAKAWVLANMPPVAPFTKWIWTPLNDVGTMVR
jgi:hypothetical protein